jgi:hypothetical protein
MRYPLDGAPSTAVAQGNICPPENARVETGAFARQRSAATPVWNGHFLSVASNQAQSRLYQISPNLSKRNSCLVSFATYGNTASPMRLSGVDFTSDLFAKNSESSRPTTAHELIVDPVRAMQLGVAVCIFFILGFFHLREALLSTFVNSLFRCKRKKAQLEELGFFVDIFANYTPNGAFQAPSEHTTEITTIVSLSPVGLNKTNYW